MICFTVESVCVCGGGGGLPFHRLQQTRDSFCGHAENKLEAKTDGNPSSSDQLTDNKQNDHISRVLDPNGCKVTPCTLWQMLTLKVGEN